MKPLRWKNTKRKRGNVTGTEGERETKREEREQRAEEDE